MQLIATHWITKLCKAAAFNALSIQLSNKKPGIKPGFLISKYQSMPSTKSSF
jgi:hypothetical protein